jgi:hemerythrin superfamily protein
MDAITLLTKDHEKVDGLFKKLEKDGFDQPDVISEIVTELTVHAEIEEEHFYPRVKPKGVAEEVEEGVEEHGEIKSLVERVKAAEAGSTEMEIALTELMAMVRHHVEEEEGEMFPEVRDNLDQSELEELGRRMEEGKAERGLNPLVDLTREELYERASEQGVAGRSDMSKDELISALGGESS